MESSNSIIGEKKHEQEKERRGGGKSGKMKREGKDKAEIHIVREGRNGGSECVCERE